MSRPLKKLHAVPRASRQILRGSLSNAQLSVLLFHRVLPAPDSLLPDIPDAVAFTRLMRSLRRFCNPLALCDALAALTAGTLPPRAVCITFDDGYADNLTVAAPILKRLNVPATVFVTTGFIDGGAMWNDRVAEAVRGCGLDRIDLRPIGMDSLRFDSTQQRAAALQRILSQIKHWPPQDREDAVCYLESQSTSTTPNLMMSADQIQELSDFGIELGAHTHTHPILSSLSESAAKQEIYDSKLILESIVQREVRYFAYPNGHLGEDYLPLHVDQVKALGFKAAFTTDHGDNTSDVDPFQLQRFTPWGSKPFPFLARLFHHRGNAC